MTRIPESEAPNIRNGSLRAEINAVVPEGANGVIFALGGSLMLAPKRATGRNRLGWDTT